MSSGTITGNTANGNQGFGYARGAGVLIDTGSTHTISGGSITGNTSASYGASDVYVDSSVNLTGDATIGNIAIWFAAQGIRLTGQFSGSATIDLERNGASVLSDFNTDFNLKAIITGSGYTLQTADINRFSLGTFRNNTGTSFTISASHRLENTGANIGRLVTLP